MSSSIIIPKHNKASYNSLKIFCFIVLLNTIGKLIEDVISKRLQFQKNFIHPCQLGGLKQWSTIDVLTHLIRAEWVKNLLTSILAFNIAQFFSPLNHQLLPLILNKASFNSRIFIFFQDYLVCRKTHYL